LSEKRRIRVASKADLIASGKMSVQVEKYDVALFHVNGEFYAWRNFCPHFAAPICHGVVTGTRLPSNVYEYRYGYENQIVRCPWHGWEFDLKTGEHLADPKTRLRGFPVETDEESVYILV